MKYIICDLDNTLLDTLGRLEELVDGYSIEEQYEYRLLGEQLEPFIDGSVYEGAKLNTEVILTIPAHMVLQYQPIFISQSMSKDALEFKLKLVEKLAKQLGRDSFPLIAGRDEIFHQLQKIEGKKVFIDDAPQRLHWFAETFPESKVYKVEYPYNKDINLSRQIILKRG